MAKVGHKVRGGRAYRSGIDFEDEFEKTLLRRGFKPYDGSSGDFLGNIHKMKQRYYMRGVGLGLSVYGKHIKNRKPTEGNQTSDFMLSGVKGHPRGLRVECKFQDCSGSADEKLLYLNENVEIAGYKTFVVWGGSGFRSGAIDCLKYKAKQNKYMIGVFDSKELRKKFKDGFLN